MLFDFCPLNDISSFVPEAALLDGKNTASCRVCREDCVVLDTSNDFLPVAYRGAEPTPNVNYFSSVELPQSEYDFLLSVLHTHNRILLHSPHGAFLVFGEFLRETGLLLVIRPRLSISPARSASTLLATLSLIGENAFVSSPSVSSAAPDFSFSDDALCKQMREFFFYADCFCSSLPFAHGLLTCSLRLAIFAGCRLECVSLPFDEQALTPAEQVRLAAFLLCVFLTLRQQADHARADLSSENAPLLRYHVSAFPNSDHISRLPSANGAVHLPFLDCACFREFHLSLSDRALCFDAILSQSPPIVNSIDTSPSYFSFFLEIA